MDGMLVIAFFFPLILFASVAASTGGFFLAVYLSFGDRLADWLQLKLQGCIPASILRLVLAVLRHPPLKRYGWFVYPAIINIIVAATVLITYNLGNVLYQKRGWKSIQPLRGGFRFVLLQVILWTMFSFSLILPWLSMKNIGMLHLAGRLKSSTEDTDAFGGLLVASAALGMLAESLVIVSLMVFDHKNSSHFSRRDIVLFDTGHLNFKMLFGQSNRKFWWMYIGLQSSMAIYSCGIAFLSESEAIADGPVQGLLLMVFVSLYAVAMALTNAVGGKWRYGEDKFHIFMPGRGGTIFAFVQGVAWMIFSCVWLVVLAKLIAITFEAKTLVDKGLMATAGTLGVVSQFLVALSLLIFDPERAGRSTLVAGLIRGQLTGPMQRSIGESFEGGISGGGFRSGSEAESVSPLRCGPARAIRRRRNARSKSPSARLRLAHHHHGTSSHHPMLNHQCWEIDRIIGNRSAHGEIGEKTVVEYLVQWSIPFRRTEWCTIPVLESKLPAGKLAETLAAYHAQRASIAQSSDVEEDYFQEEDEEHEDSTLGTVPAKRNVPLNENREDNFALHLQHDVASFQMSRANNSVDASSEEDSDEDGYVEEDDEQIAYLSHPASSLRVQHQDNREHGEDIETVSREQEWEELEDDHGNVYYYCITTDTVHHALPSQVSFA